MIHPRFDPEAGVCFFRFSCTFTCGNQLSLLPARLLASRLAVLKLVKD
jgi:hypothetical protein